MKPYQSHSSAIDRRMTVAEAAGLLGTCTRTVRRLIQRGKLPALRLGDARAHYRISEAALFEFARQHGDDLQMFSEQPEPAPELARAAV